MIKFKKILITTSLGIFLLNSNSYAQESSIVSSWAQTPFSIMKQKDLIPETLKYDDNFQEDITREEFAELVTTYFLQLNPQTLKGEDVFTDTLNPMVQLAGRLGIVNGTGEGTFSPNNKLTREQASTMFARAEKMIDKNLQTTTANSFKDKSKIANWANEGVSTMNKEGTIKGYPDNTFKPQNKMSKEQAIVVTARMARKHHIVDFTEGQQPPKTEVKKGVIQPADVAMKNYPNRGLSENITTLCKNGITIVDTMEPNTIVGDVVIEKVGLTDNGGNTPVSTATITLGEGESYGNNVMALMKDGSYRPFMYEDGGNGKHTYVSQCKESDIKTIFVIDDSQFGLAVNIPNR